MPRDLFDEEMFAEEVRGPERRREERREPREAGLRGETARRVLVAIPWIAFAIAIIVAGGLAFAIALIAIGALCMREFLTMTRPLRPVGLSAYMALAALIVTAHLGTSFNLLLVLAVSAAVVFALGARRRGRGGLTVSLGATLLGIVWIGIPLAHAVFLRELPDHGAGLLVDVLVGTFAADTGAYATGRMFGSRLIAPRISPHKTIEGVVGGFVIGTMAFWFAGLYQDWLSGADALLMGAVVAAIAPFGDLFASMLKRDLGRKDTGRAFGPHGGMLDRLDAVLFTVVAGYYLSVQLVY